MAAKLLVRAAMISAIAVSACCLPMLELKYGSPSVRRLPPGRKQGADVTSRGELAQTGEAQIPRLRGGSTSAGPAGSQSIFWPVTTCVLYFISTTITSPAMPSMANRIANRDGSTTVSPQGVELHGTLTSIDLVFTFMCTKLWGTLSDKYGRIPFMLFSSAGVSLGWMTVVYAAASHNMVLLYSGRILDGVTSCMQPLCQSAVKDISPPEKLEANFGILQGSAWGGSFIVGGVAGGLLTKSKGPEFVMKIAAAVAAFNVVATGLFARESLDKSQRAEKVNWKEANPMGAVNVLMRDRVTLLAAACVLLIWTALNGIQTNFFSYVELVYGWGREKSSILLAAAGVVISASQGIGPKTLSPRLGTAGTVKVGMALIGFGYIGMAVAPNGSLFALALLTVCAGSMCIPLLTSLVASRAKSQESGSVLAALDTANMLQKVLATQGMAALMAAGMRHGVPAAFLVVSAGCSLLSVFLWWFIEREAYLKPNPDKNT